MESRRSRNAALLAVLLAPLVASADGGPGSPAPGGTSASVSAGDPKRKPLPFRGSTLIFDQSTSPESLFAGAQQSRLPSYQWWISFRPRWYFTDKLSLRGRVDLTLEWLNSVDTTKLREPTWGDVWTELSYSGIPKVVGVQTTVGLRALWPSSLGSQMRNYIVQLGLNVGLQREFKSKAGTFELTLSVAGTHPFATATSGGLANGATYDCTSTEFSPTVCGQNLTLMNSKFNLMTTFGARYAPIEQLSINVAYVLLDAWAYDTPDVTLTDRTGGTTVVPHSPNDQRFRQNGWFLASVDWEVRKWMELSLGYYVFRPILNPDSTIGNPFWSPGGNSRVFLSVTFPIDRVYEAIRDRVNANRKPTEQAAMARAETAPLP